jgi:hypothetical protein
LAIMFSSPAMIGMLILGMFILLTFVGAIAVAIIQVSRGTFKVDFDKMATDAMAAYTQGKKKKK